MIKNLNPETTFFYLGSLTDIQPLVRFSNQCDTFIYVNLSLGGTPESIKTSFENKVSNLNNIYDDILTQPILDANFSFNLDDNLDFLSDKLNENQRSLIYDLRNVFDEIPPFVLKFNLKRIIGDDIKRDIKLIYIHNEGLKTYYKLFNNGNTAPKFICTIQTGDDGFEAPNGILNQFLKEMNSKPKYWVRGCWKNLKKPKYNYRGYLKNKKPKYFIQGSDNVYSGYKVFDKDLIYKYKHQTYKNWDSALFDDTFPKELGFENYLSHESLVIAYSSEEPEKKKNIKHKNLSIVKTKYSIEKEENFDGIILPMDVYGKINTINKKKYLKYDNKNIVQILNEVCSNYRYLKNIAIIPEVFEDELEYLIKWIESKTEVNITLFVNMPGDLIDF